MGWPAQPSEDIKIYHGVFFRGRETLGGYNITLFLMNKRVTGRIIVVRTSTHANPHFEKAGDQFLL
jgi:hypothetical protein